LNKHLTVQLFFISIKIAETDFGVLQVVILAGLSKTVGVGCQMYGKCQVLSGFTIQKVPRYRVDTRFQPRYLTTWSAYLISYADGVTRPAAI